MSDVQEQSSSDHQSALYKLVTEEPWRAGLGEPLGVFDPAWQQTPEACDGQVDWEAGTRWWACTKCGHIGRATVTYHIPVMHPSAYLQRALSTFVKQRTEKGLSIQTVIAQAMFTVAVALQYAATVPLTQLGNYIERHLVIR